MLAALVVSAASFLGISSNALKVAPPPPLPVERTSVYYSVRAGTTKYMNALMSYQYYVGYVDAAHKKIFRAVFADLGTTKEGDGGSWPERISTAPPCSSPYASEVKLQFLQDSYRDTAGKEYTGFTCELLGGWAAVEFEDAPVAAAPGSESIAPPASIAALSAKETDHFPVYFPIAWRFITSDGFRTGATSSTLVAAVTLLPNKTLDVLSFALAGDVVYAPLKAPREPGQGIDGNDAYDSSMPLAPGYVARLLRGATPAANDAEKRLFLDCEQTKFIKQAKEFFDQVKNENSAAEQAAR